MNKSNTVTCSFSMDREVYNAFKSIITRNGENVKGNIIRYMQNVIAYEIPNKTLNKISKRRKESAEKRL